jgi:hypothetical protein
VGKSPLAERGTDLAGLGEAPGVVLREDHPSFREHVELTLAAGNRLGGVALVG